MAGLSSTFPVYATEEDLIAYMGTTPANASDLLVEASAHVRRATANAVYAVDGTNAPTHQPYADAMHDATILQAAALAGIGWTVGASTASEKPAVASKSLGGASVTYEAGGGAAGESRRALVGGELVSAARQYLVDAGLISATILSGVGYVRPLARVRGWL